MSGAMPLPGLSRRQRKQKVTVAAYAALTAGEGAWMSAIEVTEVLTKKLLSACGIVWPWTYRPVAFALRRLAQLGLAEERIVTYPGTSRSVEERREYRALNLQAHPCSPLFPTVQPVVPGVARRVRGRDWMG